MYVCVVCVCVCVCVCVFIISVSQPFFLKKISFFPNQDKNGDKTKLKCWI